MPSSPERCGGTTVHGKPCGNLAKRDGLCQFHHPEMKQEAAAKAGAKGSIRSQRAAQGTALANLRVTSFAELRGALELALRMVATGQWKGAQADGFAKLVVQMRAVLKEAADEEGNTAGLQDLTDEELAALAAEHSSHIRLVKGAEG